MNKQIAINIINDIILLIEEHSQNYSHHSNSCKFLISKYSELEIALLNDAMNLAELTEWNKYFAPRIIFDGIGNKNILFKIEQLDIVLNAPFDLGCA